MAIDMRKDPLAVIVGGATGIGAATARLLSRRGWRIVIADVNAIDGGALATELAGHFYGCDVSAPDDVEALAERIDDDHGPVSGMVMCAAVFAPNTPAEETDLALWDRVMAVGYRGTFVVDTSFAKRMAAHGHGAIVNLSSWGGMRSTPSHAYGTMKAAIIRLSENLSVEWGMSGVRVNTVTPGTTLVDRVVRRLETGDRYAADIGRMTALGRLVTPEEVAEPTAFLLSPEASGITGANIVVDAGAIHALSWQWFGGVPEARPSTP